MFTCGWVVMTTKLYVGNLPFATKDEDLAELFRPHGQIESARVVTYSRSGRSKGFGFVEIEEISAGPAIEALDGFDLEGRPIKVERAKPKEEGLSYNENQQ